jgi:hypothetical protein
MVCNVLLFPDKFLKKGGDYSEEYWNIIAHKEDLIKILNKFFKMIGLSIRYDRPLSQWVSSDRKLTNNVYNIKYLVSDDLGEYLNEQETPKDLAFQKTLKRVIPDGSVYKSDYPLPYSDEGYVHVIMKYSVLPSSKIMKMEREDGTLYDAIQVHLQIDELLWKSDFDKDWERVEKTHSLPSSFWSMFEDDISDLVYKKMGLGYVEVYYNYPPFV